MNRVKKIIILIVIIILAFVSLFSILHSLKEAKKLASNQEQIDKIASDLEAAKQKADIENQRLVDLRSKSSVNQVFQDQYLKTKSLVAETDVFFNNADTNHPEIRISIKDKVAAQEINRRRQEINELLQTWSDNNAHSLETNQVLINQIKTALLFIQAYIEQLRKITADLATTNPSLTKAEISSYQKIVKNSSADLEKVIAIIKQTEILINNPAANADLAEEERQAEAAKGASAEVTNLENKLIEAEATSTVMVATSTAATTATTTDSTTGDGTTTTSRRPRIVNPEPYIIYQSNPAPYRDTGVDVVNSPATPLSKQDW